MKPLFIGNEWDFPTIEKMWTEIDKIGKEDYGLDYNEPQIELIGAEQMLDAYSSVAMPVMYDHWSFGKSFIKNTKAYEKGQMGLAYEVVINTNPTIAYLMEDNSMTMQTLVLAHAVCGHGSFFKNNYLFKQWTDADAILDYLQYAKHYIRKCEKEHGEREVDAILDACHAIKNYGVDKYKHPESLSVEVEQKRQEERDDYTRTVFSDLWRTVPQSLQSATTECWDALRTKYVDKDFPEENLLYFIEKNSVNLPTWAKGIVRIVRKTAQYFYPQMQTQLMNEGWATFTHYNIMNTLFDKGFISEGSMLEFLATHTAVTAQPDFDSPRFSGSINVYALGFAMFQDLRRICENPTDDDRKWFPDIAGTPWLTTLKGIVATYRDESFVLQFLSPKVIRDFKLFTLSDHEDESIYRVSHVHDDEDVIKIRKALAKTYNLSYTMPQIEITGVDWRTYRTLYLNHTVYDGRILDYMECKKTMAYVRFLWGFGAEITYVDSQGSMVSRVTL